MRNLFLTKTRWLVTIMLLITIGVSFVWGDTKTFDNFTGLGSSSYSSGSTTSSPITLSSTGWYGYSASQLRVKSGCTISVSCSDGYKITKVVFTATSTSYNKLSSPVSWSGTTGTFTDASGVTSQAFSNSAQCRFSSIVVTYESTGGGGGTSYTLVTNAASLSAGDVIVFGSASANKVAGNLSGTYLVANTATISEGVLTAESALEFTLSKSGDNWIFNNSTNQLRAASSSSLALTNSGGCETWTISISSNNATITSTNASYGTLYYNSGSPRFRNYTSAQAVIQIYRKEVGCSDPTALSKGATTHATTGGNGQQVLNWSGSPSNYEVYYKQNSSTPSASQEPSRIINGAKTCTLTGLTAGTYYWWVRSICGDEKGDWVAGTSFTINGIKLGGTIPVAFGSVEQGSSVTSKTINVTGVGLASGTNITASFPTGSPFSVSPTSVAYNASSATLTISASSATVGAYDQNLTLSYGSTYSATVRVTMTVYCEKSVTLAHNSPSNGTVSFSPTGPIASCAGAVNTTMTITPAAGYQLTGWSTSGVSPSSTNPAVSTSGSASQAAQSIALTFAQGTNGTYTANATFSAKPLNSISLSPASGIVYVGQYAEFTITYDPADILTKGTTLVSTPSYCVTTGTTNTTLKITGGRGGVTITEDVTETVSIQANADNTKTADVSITVKPLPLVHFVDIIHSYEFSDVAGTIEDNALVSNKTTPTHEEFSGSGGANACENQHTRLVGWVEKNWADEHPNATKETMEAADTGIYFTAGATINVLTYNGNTYYAVWAKLQ